MIITTVYELIGKFDKRLDSSRVGFAPPAMERYSYGPLNVTTSIIVWLDTGDYITGCLNTSMRNKNKTNNEEKGIVSMWMTQEDTNTPWVL